jgi:hypothetical protein
MLSLTSFNLLPNVIGDQEPGTFRLVVAGGVDLSPSFQTMVA